MKLTTGNSAPSYMFYYDPWMRRFITLDTHPGILLINAATGERDFSMFGSYADEFKKRWDDFEATRRDDA